MEDYIFLVTILIGWPVTIWLMCYLSTEQKHRQQLVIEKAKQGIFDTKSEDNIKTKLESVLITVVILAIIVLIFYALKIPSNFLKYVISAIS